MKFNCTKCKFMLVSRKRTHTTPSIPLHLNGSVLEEVATFKYLGVLLSADLSWTQHVQNTCSKARRLVGLLYRRYYQHSEFNTLCQLYSTLVRPHLEYASTVWSPHLRKDVALLEDIQKFSLRVCSKQWGLSYPELLSLCNIPTLENRRIYLRLCQIFKIVNNLCFFPPDVIVPKTTLSHSARLCMLQQPFARTSSFYYSFVPDSIRRWNCLPEELVLLPTYDSFKCALRASF